MLQTSSPRALVLAGGGVYPERSRGTRRLQDTVTIHTNTNRAAKKTFETTDAPFNSVQGRHR